MLERDVPRDVIVTAIEAAERHEAGMTRHVSSRDGKSKAALRAKKYRENKKRDASRDETQGYIDSSSKIEIQKEEVKKDSPERHASVTQSDWPSDFQNQFWLRCPRKIAKVAAMKVLDRVHRSGLPWATFDAGLRRWATEAARSDPKFVKHPATWLNGGCWDDEPTKFNGAHHEADRSVSAAATRLIDGGFRLGPRPGTAEYNRLRTPDRQGNLLPSAHADAGRVLPER